ncbi:hypothetical protein DAMNIGENAA_08830 [Desulforhabdus amnigena]|jgi:predicted RNA-binding Zn-ribbon protein involved in translation (DUF1610 family)|uniref:Uncharacterized protein n=1 Tax=Desulforhabdus amnigena TaxID=40218 RepID=A0A9W6D075_9BACT|nr:hypothetical protein DAMNIGENAA_08830 [Desulforhabdus amnigena]
MEHKQLRCEDCGWVGNAFELVRVNFTMGDPQPCCPNCGGDRIGEFELPSSQDI